MKKIAIISYGGLPLPPVKGGAVENLIHFLVQNNEERKIAELTVFSSFDEKANTESQKYINTKFVYIKNHTIADKITGFTNRVIRKLRFGAVFQSYPYLIDIVKLIKKSDFDCIIVENRAEFMPYLRKKVNVPLILHMHNDYLNNKYYLARKILNSSAKVIAVSDYVKNCVLTINENAENVDVLRNVIDVKRFMNVPLDVRNRLRKEYKIKDSDVVFAFIGRVTPGKGVAELVEAFSILAEKHSNVKLLVVGAKWFSASSDSDFIKRIRLDSEKIKEKIVFTGYVDYNHIAEMYACSDVVVVPSIVGEAVSLACLETMAAGKALIASDSGGIPEHIDSQCSIEVPRGENFVKGLVDAMDKLVLDRELRNSMGAQGRIRSLMYDKEKYLDRLLELIED